MHFILSRLSPHLIVLVTFALLVGLSVGYFFGYDHGFEHAIAQR